MRLLLVLAERGAFGVFPSTALWRERPERDHRHLGTPNAFVVTTETNAQGVDVWTPVAA